MRSADADDAFDLVSGTLGLTGAPDTIIVIRRDSKGTTLHARGRDLVDVEKAMNFNPETCVWSVVLAEWFEADGAELGCVFASFAIATSDSLCLFRIASGSRAGPRTPITAFGHQVRFRWGRGERNFSRRPIV